jgi:membrane fusion protein, multidrug efflux system
MRRSSIILVLALMLAGIGVALVVRRRADAPEPKGGSPAGRGQTPPVPVLPGTVAQRDVPVYLDGLGTVQAFNTVTVRARVDGQLNKVEFVEGQDVTVGQRLALIDPAPFRAALEQVTAKKGQDEAQLANARVDLNRYADLLTKQGVTEQVYDTQKALVRQLEATVHADQAGIESAKVLLNYTEIVSPIDGRTGIRLVDEGNIIHANDTTGLVVITQLRPISVVFTLPEQMLDRIRQQTARSGPELPVLAVAQDSRTVLGEGKLAVVDNQIDTTTGTIRLKATFPNPDLRLWPGQFVNARLLLNVRTNSTVVPESVIQRGPEGAFAFVIKPDQTVEVRPVQVAQMAQGEAVIESGLRPGEQVVVDGQYKLQKGSRVTIESKSETLNPKSEGNMKPDDPNPKPNGSSRSGN